MSSTAQTSRPSTPSKGAVQPSSRPSTPSNIKLLPGETIDRTVVIDTELAKLVTEHFKGAECVFGINQYDSYFVRIYSSAGDVLVYDNYSKQKQAMTGAKTALKVIAELRKPKNARNNEILKNVKGNLYFDLLLYVDTVAHGATVTWTVKDDDHQNIQITLPSTGTGKPVVLSAGPDDFMIVMNDARKVLNKHLKITTTS